MEKIEREKDEERDSIDLTKNISNWNIWIQLKNATVRSSQHILSN